jgi:hypothetical protein
LVVVAATVFLASPAAAADDRPLPWEVWKTPSVVAQVTPGMHTVMVSSTDPGGGALDRHSGDDPRFVVDDNGEGILFTTTGAGAITRIWMTQGDGISADLDPGIRPRIRIDGATEPVVDLTLRVFFLGNHDAV